MDRNRAETYPLRRRQVVASLLAERGDMLVVAGLGAPAWDATAAGDHPLTFPLWGAMGGAAMIGLGLAVARPERRVLVITGDGRDADGAGQPRHHRRAGTRQPRRRRPRQRALRRDRHAGHPHRPRRGHGGHGGGGRPAGHRHRGQRSRTRGGHGGAAGRRGTGVLHPSRYAPRTCLWCCHPATASSSKNAFRAALLGETE